LAAKETYSSTDNTSELFGIESALHNQRQGDLTVTQYFSALTRQWQQLDIFETYEWKCADDTARYKEIIEKKRIFRFLLGLNNDLDDVRGRILSIKPMPKIREVFAEVR
jgi:hypothetical protein